MSDTLKKEMIYAIGDSIMTKEEAIAAVENGEAQRICAPGEWVVWREGDIVMSKDLPQ